MANGTAAAVAAFLSLRDVENERTLKCPRCKTERIVTGIIYYLCKECGAFISKDTFKVVNCLKRPRNEVIVK